jgi:hypothetical protein
MWHQQFGGNYCLLFQDRSVRQLVNMPIQQTTRRHEQKTVMLIISAVITSHLSLLWEILWRFTASNGWMTGELERIRKEDVLPKSKYYFGIFLKELRKITTNISEDRRWPCSDSNQAPSEYRTKCTACGGLWGQERLCLPMKSPPRGKVCRISSDRRKVTLLIIWWLHHTKLTARNTNRINVN